MATSDTRNEPGRAAVASGDIGGKLAREVDAIVAGAEGKSENGQDEKAYWFYSVPFPGARYYSFVERAIPPQDSRPEGSRRNTTVSRGKAM